MSNNVIEFPLSFDINEANLRSTRMAVALLINKATLPILKVLLENQGATVSFLQEKTQITQSSISSYLSKMRRTGLVRASQEGRNRRYYFTTNFVDLIEFVNTPFNTEKG